MVVCAYPAAGVQAELMSIGFVFDPMTNVHPQSTPLLHKYGELVVVPKTLPPHRKHNHKIPLQDNTKPINIRPYRHPSTQKDAIEEIDKELLESRVIRTSHNPFSSPIVMVKKKDGSLRMRLDYRELNKQTVKDKFPIPIIKKLIDELFGAQVFAKLDFRSRYHQIRMCEEDFNKTTFRTHQNAMVNAPVLALLNFQEEFIVETDDSRLGLWE
ncbi:hypothetical protein Tco_0768656 [Tanacetum coccineum]